MYEVENDTHEIILQSLALASRLEGEGQYNNAKLIRAGVESVLRKGAYQRDIPPEHIRLVRELEQAATFFSRYGLGDDLANALKRGSSALADGRLPQIVDTPNPFVCRTCGYLALNELPSRCPDCGSWSTTYKIFPPVYWLTELGPKSALERMRKTAVEIEEMLVGLTEEQCGFKVTEHEWSIYQLITHIRDAQGVLSSRLTLLLEQDDPSLESKAVFEWASKTEDESPTSGEIFESYKQSRYDTISTLEGIPLADWWRTGRHEEFDQVTILQQVSYFTVHELTHLPAISFLRSQVLSG